LRTSDFIHSANYQLAAGRPKSTSTFRCNRLHEPLLSLSGWLAATDAPLRLLKNFHLQDKCTQLACGTNPAQIYPAPSGQPFLRLVFHSRLRQPLPLLWVQGYWQAPKPTAAPGNREAHSLLAPLLRTKPLLGGYLGLNSPLVRDG
jgi:hypothetical protein